MVKRIISVAFLFLPIWVAAQNCNICPSGTTVTLQSTYPPSATHYWSCTNGFTSNLVSPTFTLAADVTCTLVVTDASGCTSTSQTIVDICNCDCNDPCVSMNYNSTTDCVTFNNIGSNCSPVSTDVIEWKNQNTSYATIANGSQICNCNIKEYVNTSAAVTINGSDFRLTINGLQNRCSTCSGSNMRIDFQFPLSGSTSSFPGCAATTYWLTISPAQFATNGYVCDAYVRYTTPFGIVVNQYRFQYNGGGLNMANVTVTEIVKRTIYKDITARRTVTYTDGCPQEQCEILLDIPQQPNDPCTHFVAYVSNVNIGAPCNGPGYNANTINGTAPITYQWYYNGTLLSGQTGQFFCLVGQPFGTYCVQITDAAGCTENVCRVYQASCNLTASITLSGTTLTAVLTGGTGTATYQWQRWNGTAWVNVGTNASTYNTGGVAGDYRVNVTCSGPPVCNAIATYTYTPPCTADVTITTGTTTLTANVTGCGGVNITYVWDRWNGTAWVTVQTVTTTSTSNVYTPTLSGLYRVTITCGSCSDQAQTSWTAPNPCTGFSAAITGTFTGLCVGTAYTYNRTITGGTSPYTQTWKVNGTTVGTGTTYTYTPTAVGTYTLTVTVVDANHCSYTDTKTITVINCCGLSVSLSPDITVCVNQSGTFTATPTGGTAPITYSWTSQLPPAAPVSQGTGNPKSLTFATAGTYTIQVTATDANNCTAVASRNMVVQTCTNCTCTPTLTLVGCQLQGGTTGAGCGNFSYQLQYSPTGTGWTTVLSGLAFNGWTFTHTPAANGVYRLVIFATGCNLQQTPDVVVNCVPNCSCTAGTLTFASCDLSWTNPCSGAGYTASLEYFNGTSWVYVTQTTPYTPQLSGQYRVKYAKAGCPDVLSNVVNVTSCCNCTPTLVFDYACQFQWTVCGLYTSTLQKLVGGTWTNITTTNPYNAPQTLGSGSFRVRYVKSGCPDVISNVVVLPCDANIQSFTWNCATGVFEANVDAALGNVYYEFYRCADPNALACDEGGMFPGCTNSVLMSSGYVNPSFNITVSPLLCLNQAYTLKIWNCYDSTCADYSCIFGVCTLSPIVKTGCTLTWNNSQYGYTVFLQRLVSGVWTDINSSGTYTMTNPSSFSYRLRATTSTSNCGDSFTVSQTFSCP